MSKRAEVTIAVDGVMLDVAVIIDGPTTEDWYEEHIWCDADLANVFAWIDTYGYAKLMDTVVEKLVEEGHVRWAD
jgi:hypothetical protein